MRSWEQFQALVVLQLKGFRRSRMPLLWFVFALVWAWYDWEVADGPGVSEMSWVHWSLLVSLTGFLAGYETYIKLRENGSLRLILLQPVSPWVLAAAFFFASGVLVLAMLLLYAGYLVIAGVPSPVHGIALIVWISLLTGLGYMAYTQTFSIVLPRDTAAVLGLLFVYFTAESITGYLPSGTPDWIRLPVQTLEMLLPSSSRLIEVSQAGGRYVPYMLLMFVHLIIGVVAAKALAGRASLRQRAND